MLAALARIFAEALSDRYRQWESRERLLQSQTGAITFLQRFGSSLNLNVHFDVVLDGVFVRDETKNAVLHAAPHPSRDELEQVHRRVSKWLVRHGHVDTSPLEARSNETPSTTPLDACAVLATQRGTTTTMRDDGEEEAEQGSGARAAPAHEAADQSY